MFEELRRLIDTYGKDTVNQMITDLASHPNKEKSRLYGILKNSNPTATTDMVSVVNWVLQLPEYAELVEKGRAPNNFPTRTEIKSWAVHRGLPLDGTDIDEFVGKVRAKIGLEGLDPAPFLGSFDDPTRLNELEKNLYIIVGKWIDDTIII